MADDTGYKVPSLALLAYMVFRRNALDRCAKKVISYNHVEFQLLESLTILHRNMCTRIEELVCYNSGEIFGGYCRDYIALSVPKDIDARFISSEDRETFIAKIVQEYDIFFVQKKNNPYSDDLRHCLVITILVVHREFRQIFIPMDLTVSSDWLYVKPDFDVNQLTMSTPGQIYFNTSPHDQRVLTKRILAKMLVVFDANGDPNPDHELDGSDCIDRRTPHGKRVLTRMVRMRSRGWTIEGDESCSNPKCILSPEASWKAYCDNLVAERLARKIARDIARKANVIRNWEWASSCICPYEPPNFKDLHQKKIANRRRAKEHGKKPK